MSYEWGLKNEISLHVNEDRLRLKDNSFYLVDDPENRRLVFVHFTNNFGNAAEFIQTMVGYARI